MELTNDFHVGVPVDEAWAVLTDVEKIAPCMPGAQLEEIEGDEYRGSVKVKVGPITAQYKGKARFVTKDDAAHIAVLRAEGRDSKGQGNASATITATLVQSGTGTNVTVTTDLTVTGRVAQFGRGVMEDVSKKLLGQFVQCLEHDILADPAVVASSIATASAAAAEMKSGASAGGSGGAGTGGGGTDGGGTDGGGTDGGGTDGGGAATVTATTTATSAGYPTEAVPSANGAAASGAGAASAAETKPTVRKIEYKAAEPVDLLNTAGAPVVKRVAPAMAALLIVLWLLRRRKRG